jgi:hypothetical protein
MSYMNSKFRTVASALVDQRTAVRHPVQLQRATVRRHAAQAIPALLEDISVYGCRVVVDDPFAPGDRLWLRLAASEPVSATAIWYDKGKLGCRFDGPLESTLLRNLTLGSD